MKTRFESNNKPGGAAKSTLFRPANDWETWIGGTALLLLCSWFMISAHNKPAADAARASAHVQVQDPDMHHTAAPTAWIAYEAGANLTPPRPSPLEQERTTTAAGEAVLHMDFVTFKDIQTATIQDMRKRIRQHGVRGDGITEADLDRMLKNGDAPF